MKCTEIIIKESYTEKEGFQVVIRAKLNLVHIALM